MLYYRLKMIDTDGRYSYSNIIQLRKDVVVDNRIISLAPNPSTSTLTMQYESTTPEKVEGNISTAEVNC
ncbi:MAG: hypothetical protein H7Y86_08305 [Rhizobacter sp.]|nr:hypothetical protein [Ferruginibacter sp.]